MIRSALPKQFACKRQQDETVKKQAKRMQLEGDVQETINATTEGRMHSMDDQVKEVTRVAEVSGQVHVHDIYSVQVREIS